MQDKFMTDLTLTLVDFGGQNNITMNVHKLVLATSSPYFEKMFGQFKEGQQSEIILEVEHSAIAHDLIMSWYGCSTNVGDFPKWLHCLETIKLSDYWGLSTNHLTISDFPTEEYDYLLHVAQVYSKHKVLVDAIIKFRPDDYPMSVLQDALGGCPVKKTGLYMLVEKSKKQIESSPDYDLHKVYFSDGEKIIHVSSHRISSFRHEIIFSPTNYLLGIPHDSYFNVVSLKNPDKNKSLGPYGENIGYAYSLNGQYLAILHGKYLIIYSVETWETILYQKFSNIKFVEFSPNSTQILIIEHNTLVILNLLDKSVLFTYQINPNVCGCFSKFSPCGRKICVGTSQRLYVGEKIFMINIETAETHQCKLINHVVGKDNHKRIAFLPDNKIVWAVNNSLYIWSPENDTIDRIYTFDWPYNKTKKLTCSPSGIIHVLTSEVAYHLDTSGSLLNTVPILDTPESASNTMPILDYMQQIEYYPDATYYHCKITNTNFF